MQHPRAVTYLLMESYMNAFPRSSALKQRAGISVSGGIRQEA